MPEPVAHPADRRPLRSRSVPLFIALARRLAAVGVTPNFISCVSVVFAAGAATALVATALAADARVVRICWLAAAGLIQLRLLANMLDGMLAIESAKATATGELFNEVPDRIADPVILIAAGYAAGSSPELGYLAAVAALFVAYVRAIGAHAAPPGTPQAFHGPMAKPHRMFTLTVACLWCALTPAPWQPTHASSGLSITAAALALIVVGCLVTAVRRLRFIASHLRRKPLP